MIQWSKRTALKFWKALGFGRSKNQEQKPELSEVFTPSSPANKTYVPRPIAEKDLRSALGQPGTQVVVYGESGAGKSSLTLRVFEELDRAVITTRCDGTTTYNVILESAFHKIGAFSNVGQKDNEEANVTTQASVGKKDVVSVGVQSGFKAAQENTFAPVVSAPITAEHLATLLGEQATSWIIEDFHKANDETKDALSHALKVFSDNAAKYPKTAIVVLGAADTAADVWGSPANMRGRLVDIAVNALTNDELGAIVDAGAEILNVDFSEVRTEIIEHSVGLASVTHALAFGCCEALEIGGPASEQVTVDAQVLEEAKVQYSRMRSADIKQDFVKALVVKASRKYENHALILKALAGLGESGGTHAELLAAVRQLSDEDYPSSNLTTYLKQLQTEARGSVIRKTGTGQFRFAKPIMHTYARQLFGVSTNGTFWSGIEATQSERESASLALTVSE
jgi:hypothetical protein